MTRVTTKTALTVAMSATLVITNNHGEELGAI